MDNEEKKAQPQEGEQKDSNAPNKNWFTLFSMISFCYKSVPIHKVLWGYNNFINVQFLMKVNIFMLKKYYLKAKRK